MHFTSSMPLAANIPSKLHRLPRSADRLGSPTSIPSSPTSIRSSSSAIFERDIEPIVSHSPPNIHHHHLNPHRIPRAKTTEQLDQSVPSVLDSAATILAGMKKDDVVGEVAVLSPAASIFELVERSSGFASPISSLRSRSSSPVGSKVGTSSQRTDILLSIPVSPQAASIVQSPASVLGLQNMGSSLLPSQLPSTVLQSQARVPRPFIQTTPSTSFSEVDSSKPSHTLPIPILPIKGSNSSSRQSSPRTTTLEQFPTFIQSGSQNLNYFPPIISSSLPSHPPSPVHLQKERLSFMSYNDLLSSTPTTTQPLSSLTTCASAADPPPHIPSVSGLNIVSAVYSSGSTSRAPSLRGLSLGGLAHPGKRDSIHSVQLMDNIGGEWDREGLGKGLEERLDALIIPGPLPTVPIGGKA